MCWSSRTTHTPSHPSPTRARIPCPPPCSLLLPPPAATLAAVGNHLPAARCPPPESPAPPPPLQHLPTATSTSPELPSTSPDLPCCQQQPPPRCRPCSAPASISTLSPRPSCSPSSSSPLQRAGLQLSAFSAVLLPRACPWPKVAEATPGVVLHDPELYDMMWTKKKPDPALP
nr:uncharacterized protein LOC127346805 [Lolium perenne]